MNPNGDITFSVSSPGQDVRDSAVNNLLMTAKYPFAKLDSTNNVSFLNLAITFTHNVTYPAYNGGFFPDVEYGAHQLVYQYPHGYKYQPAVWAMGLVNFTAFDGSTFPSYQNGTLFSIGELSVDATGTTAVAMWITADATNVYIYLLPTMIYQSSTPPDIQLDITGKTVKLRVYCFADDLQQN